MDKRKLNRLHRRRKRAQDRVNIKIHEKIEELKKDKKFMEKIDKEIKNLDEKQLKRYINSKAYKISKDEDSRQKRILQTESGNEAG